MNEKVIKELSIITEEGKLIPGYLPPEDLLNQLTSKS